MILENLARLNQAKVKIRDQSFTSIAADTELLDHTAIIETWMDAIASIASQRAKTEDGLTIQFLGIRLFNSTACALDLIFSGFYQASIPHTRDVIEVNFLLTDFYNNPTLVKRWRESNTTERKKVFRPLHVRKRIDDADGYTQQRRKKAYDTLSNYGVHATPEGRALLMRDGLPVPGPFYNFSLLKASLEELTLRLSTGTLSFTAFFIDYPETMDVHKMLLAKTEEWRNRYFNPPRNPTMSAPRNNAMPAAPEEPSRNDP